MTYKLVYTARAMQDAAKLDVLAKKRISKKILFLTKNPISKSVKLKSARLGTYRYRIGNYRVIYDLSGKEIIILRIGHRKEIYR